MSFTKPFDRYVCNGDSIQCEAEGFTITARIVYDEHARIDDTDCYPEEFSTEIFGEDTPEHRAHFETALAARDAWLRDEWFFCGIVLSVARNGVTLDKHAASVWALEANFPGSDNAYLLEVANELLPEALEAAKATLAKLCKGVCSR